MKRRDNRKPHDTEHGTEPLEHIDLRSEADDIPRDEQGRPDLSYFTEPLEHYIKRYEEFLAIMTSKRRLSRSEAHTAWINRLIANWGLIAKGSDALPYVMKMLKSSVQDAREDAAGILPEIGRQEEVVDAVLQAVETEQDPVALDSMIDALGELGNKKAVPLLARFVRDRVMDQETSWAAMESLGRLVHKKFDKQADPMQAAEEWLTKHGH